MAFRPLGNGSVHIYTFNYLMKFQGLFTDIVKVSAFVSGVFDLLNVFQHYHRNVFNPFLNGKKNGDF